MEKLKDSQTNERSLRLRLVRQTLKSWRFFLLFSVPPLVWTLFSTPSRSSLAVAVIAMINGVCWFNCWRLWLDAHYLSLIDEENNTQAGEALAVIWQREKLRAMAFDERQQGAQKRCRWTLYWIAILWLCWLILLFLT